MSTCNSLAHAKHEFSSSDAPACSISDDVGTHISAPGNAIEYFGFQSLPTEVRIKIWEVYEVKKPGDSFIGSSKNGRATDGDAFKTEVQRYSGHAARQLCRKFNDEILDMFFQRNGFEFFHTTVLLEFMEWSGVRARSWIKKIRIHFSITPVAISTRSAAHTAYKGLRYLKSCTRLESLEIDARIIPELVKACWLSYPVLDPLNLVRNTVGKDGVEILFGDEKRYRHDALYLHVYNEDRLAKKSEKDQRMISMTKDMVSKALLKVLSEPPSPASVSSLPNINEGAPRMWKGVPPKEKAEAAKARARKTKQSRRCDQTHVRSRFDIFRYSEGSCVFGGDWSRQSDEHTSLGYISHDLSHTVTKADITRNDTITPYGITDDVDELAEFAANDLPRTGSNTDSPHHASVNQSILPSSDIGIFLRPTVFPETQKNDYPPQGIHPIASDPSVSLSRFYRSPNMLPQRHLTLTGDISDSESRPTDTVPSSFLQEDDAFMNEFVDFNAKCYHGPV